MPKSSEVAPSKIALWLRMQSIGCAVLIIWLTGTYVLDWIGAANWTYWVWIGAIGIGWIIGGNVLRFYQRGGPNRRDWVGLAAGGLLIIAAICIGIEKWDWFMDGIVRR